MSPFRRAHCAKCVGIRSYSGPYCPAFGLNMERYGVSLRNQSKCGKIRTRITPNMDTFHSVTPVNSLLPAKGEQKGNGMQITVSTNEIHQLDLLKVVVLNRYTKGAMTRYFPRVLCSWSSISKNSAKVKGLSTKAL